MTKPPMKTESVIDSTKAGIEVRDARINARMGMRELAKLIGVSQTTIHLLEHGTLKWTQERYEKAMKAIEATRKSIAGN